MTRSYAAQWRDEKIIQLFMNKKTPKEIYLALFPEVTSIRIVYRAIRLFHVERKCQNLTLPDLVSDSKTV